MKVGDLVRFMVPAQRTEGSVGIIIDLGEPKLPDHVKVLWSNQRKVLERKIFLECWRENDSWWRR